MKGRKLGNFLPFFRGDEISRCGNKKRRNRKDRENGIVYSRSGEESAKETGIITKSGSFCSINREQRRKGGLTKVMWDVLGKGPMIPLH